MVLVSSFSNFFSNTISHANNWIRKKIPTCSNSALELIVCTMNQKHYNKFMLESQNREILVNKISVKELNLKLYALTL